MTGANTSPEGSVPGQPQPPAAGSFAPLRHAAFAVLWLATVFGNTGSFMRDVASAWIVTDLSPSPLAVSIIQAAGTLPVFLLALPAGVLSDILDRRKFLIFVQAGLALVSLTLAYLAYTTQLSVGSLAALTFLGGIGAALVAPAWQSIVPELVPRQDLKNAVTLNSLGVNISRAIGPAAGGLLLAAYGAAVTYGIDVASYILVIGALLWWRRPAKPADALSENFFGAFRAGLRYARANRDLHAVLLRALVFFSAASAIWALLPLVSRQLLKGDASLYGMLLGAVGIGAILGAIVLPNIRRRLSTDGVILTAALAFATVLAVMALVPQKPIAIMLLAVLGAAWITALTTLGGLTQAILPNWVRGRGLAIYLMTFNGAMAGGSLFWGFVAREVGVSSALFAAAGFLAVSGLLLRLFPLPRGDADLNPSNHWADPLVHEPPAHDRGPVLIMIEYFIAREQREDFLAVLNRLSDERRRDGAHSWGVAEDSANPERIVEWFMVESWAEHMRQHRRVSQADADLQNEAARFHIGPRAPKVEHFLAIAPRRAR